MAIASMVTNMIATSKVAGLSMIQSFLDEGEPVYMPCLTQINRLVSSEYKDTKPGSDHSIKDKIVLMTQRQVRPGKPGRLGVEKSGVVYDICSSILEINCYLTLISTVLPPVLDLLWHCYKTRVLVLSSLCTALAMAMSSDVRTNVRYISEAFFTEIDDALSTEYRVQVVQAFCTGCQSCQVWARCRRHR